MEESKSDTPVEKPKEEVAEGEEEPQGPFTRFKGIALEVEFNDRNVNTVKDNIELKNAETEKTCPKAT